jgi:hypothetical protein
MNLDEAQKSKVRTWIEQGMQPAEVQNRIADEFGQRLTYMEVRFLLADLNLKPKDKEPPVAPPPALGAKGPEVSKSGRLTPDPQALSEDELPGGVSVTVDQLTRPGAVVSGKVKFSDGKSADWYLDQMGRLGLAAPEKGYKPSQHDLMEFQAALQNELAKLGF